MWAKLSIILLALSLGGCISLGGDDKEEKQTGLGERGIKYYSNKTVTSLEIPPDLTKPSSQGAFRISEYVKNVHEDVGIFTDLADKVAEHHIKVEAGWPGRSRFALCFMATLYREHNPPCLSHSQQSS